MFRLHSRIYAAFIALAVSCTAAIASAQSVGNSGSINGTVTDPSGAVVPGVQVEIHNPVSGYDRAATTDASGHFEFTNVPFNPYHLTVTGPGFAPYVQDVEPRSTVPVTLNVKLQVEGASTSVTVEANGGDLVENDSTFHTDVDKNILDRIPLESQSSQVSSAVTLSTPGIAADSNGLFHGLGDHAQNSFSIDGQPITDQQSKVFSNQIPLDAIQSMEVISGAPPAEYDDKTSIVIDVTTQSGLGASTPHGSVFASYGSFGSSNAGFNLAYGGKKWGNFISANAMNSGRFLDPPEFVVMHAKGNEENLFDRIDFQISNADSVHINLEYTRSWFQTPNSYDAENATPWSGLNGILPSVQDYGGIAPNGQIVGPTDQRSKIGTFNIAPSWTRLLGTNFVFTLGAWVRRDAYNYYPSEDPFADLGAPSLQRESVGPNRSLTNAGARSSFSHVKGIHNLKGGIQYEQTFLDEKDTVGIVDPILNAPCLTLPTAVAPNVPVPGFSDPAQCTGAGLAPNVADSTSPLFNANAPNTAFYPAFNPNLLPYDLTRNGIVYSVQANAPYLTHTDVKQLAMYVEDTFTKGPWNFGLGVRGDLYNGLTTAQEAQPRLGAAYNIKQSNTELRLSYARTMETPFNENLILSSLGCTNDVLAPLLICSAPSPNRLSPGVRNEYHAGIEQAFGKHAVFSGEYIWKYTQRGFDFSVLGNTPITFPIEWYKSKIPGFGGRVNVPSYHGFSALMVFSSVAARFFQPQIGGAGATVATAAGLPFRIDHDEKFNQTTHLQYQIGKRGPWLGFNWRYDSGLVAGATPCFGLNTPYNDCPGSFLSPTGVPTVSMIAANVGGVPLSANQEFQAGFFCGSQRATPTSPLPFNCPASQFGSTLLRVPAPGTENDDHNPPRVDPRHLFDLAIGDDHLAHFANDRYRISAQITVINLANNYALYNFLSTFSGTHYVTPRALTAEIGLHC
jgi:Carboxypeptidase regulatory-like domain/TonB-dependent Receptor Plug Domain